MIRWIPYLLLVISISMMDSCQPEEVTPPAILIEHPVAGASFQANDTIPLTITVSDEVGVKSVLVVLYDEHRNVVNSLSESVKARNKTLKLGFPIETPSLESGKYILEATAYSEVSSAKASVSLHITQADRMLNYFLLWAENVVTLLHPDGSVYNESGSLDRIRQVEVKHGTQSYVTLNEDGIAECRDLQTHEKIWTSAMLAGHGQVRFQSMVCDDLFVYGLSTTQQVYKIDHLGGVVLKRDTWFHPLAITSNKEKAIISVDGDDLRITWKDQLISTNVNTGLATTLIITADEVGDVYVGSTDNSSFYWHQFVPTSNVLKQVFKADLPNPLVQRALTAFGRSFVLTPDKVLVYQAGDWIEVAGSMSESIDLKASYVSKALYVLTQTELLQVNPDTGMSLPLAQIMGQRGIELVYSY